MGKSRPPLPPPVRRALGKLGTDLKDARRRRRLPMAHVADRALISRPTLQKVERGDPGVSLGIYATVLHGDGMLGRLEHRADAATDRAGLAQEAARLPRRVRRPLDTGMAADGF